VRTIGLIGGMSWESSLVYYRLINQHIRDQLGGLHSARCILYSVDFAEIEAFQQSGHWDESGEVLARAAQSLEQAGADCIVLCTNTMHKVASAIEQRVSIPLLHIADATAEQICAQGIGTVGLLGTRFTMEEDFYAGRLAENWGLQVLIPMADQRALVNNVIYDELVLGIINPASRNSYALVIEGLIQRGAQAIILGCTEIGLLVQPQDSLVPCLTRPKSMRQPQ
jgi:aspartate racemase